jgi:hypothetical protein
MASKPEAVPRPHSTQPAHYVDDPLAAAEAYIKRSKRGTRMVVRQLGKLRRKSASREKPLAARKQSSIQLGLKPLHPAEAASSPYLVDPYARSLPAGTISNGHVDISKILHHRKQDKRVGEVSSQAVLRGVLSTPPASNFKAQPSSQSQARPPFKPIETSRAPAPPSIRQTRTASVSRSPPPAVVSHRKPSQLSCPPSAKPHKMLSLEVRFE